MSTAPLQPAASMPRPSVIQLAIKEKAALYAAYIPLFSDGGIFIPSTKEYTLGDDVYLLLSLPEYRRLVDSQKGEQEVMLG